jgi:hypothetical protein
MENSANRKSKLQLYEWSPSKSLHDDYHMVNHGLKLSEGNLNISPKL